MRSLFYFFIGYFFFLLNAFSQKVNINSRAVWIKPVQYDYNEVISQDDISSSYCYFMRDFQVNVSAKTKYYHYAYKIFNNKGVENASKLYLNYNPAFQKLVIHSLIIHRGGTKLNKLKTSKIDDIQREEELDDNIYNGDRTVSIIIDDVRSGDIIEYEYSLTGTNPIFKGKFYFGFYLNDYNSIKHVSCRIIKPFNLQLNIKCLNKLYEPVIERVNNTEVLTWQMTNVPGLKSEESAPYYIDIYDLVEVSEYGNWKEVVDWGREVFNQSFKPSVLLEEKIASFKSFINPEIQTIKALRFVQNDIRYFGIEMGVNSHKPKLPNDVLLNGYGDCKDKAFLFCYILNKLNIKAYPVLINTEKRMEMLKLIPTPSQFNHVIAMVVLNGDKHFFDPTIPNQSGDIKHYYSPNYCFGLPLKDSIDYLCTIPIYKNSEIKLQEFYNLKSMKGDASLSVKTFYSGGKADDVRYKFLNSNVKDIQDTYYKFYEGIYKNISSAANLSYSDNDINNVFVSTEAYDIANLWDENSEGNGKLSLSFSAHFIKDELDQIDIKSKDRKTPLSLSFASSFQHIINITLPEAWNINQDEKTIDNKYIHYQSKASYIKNKLKLTYTLYYKEPMVSSEDYTSFKQDVQNIYSDLNYTLTWNEKIDIQTKSSNVNWLIVLIALLILILSSLLFAYLYRKMKINEDNTLVPLRLGGWLWFPFIGLGLNITLIVFSLLGGNYFNKTFWLLRTDESSTDYISGFSSIIIFELFANIFIICMSVFLIASIIKSYRDVPKYMVAYYLLYFSFAILDHVFTSLIIDKTDLYYLSSAVIRTMISSGIWIPYFLQSERVKVTFVN